MNKNFDAVRYAMDAGRELIASFADAGLATSPGLVGSAREAPTRRKLQSLLPKGIAVGSGCVIDSYGGTSRQIDVVLYERHLCPVYSINDDPTATYYPCEGVIAIGEIKSRMASADLEDTFAKIASVKQLRRYAVRSSDAASDEIGLQATVPFRPYGSPNSMLGTETEEFNQDSNPFDQVFGFSLAGSLGVEPKNLCAKYVELAARTGRILSPNMIVTLNDAQILTPSRIRSDRRNPEITISAHDANAVYGVTRPEGGFQFLLSRIYTVYRRGRTVEEVAFDRYFAKDGRLELPGDGTVADLK